MTDSTEIAYGDALAALCGDNFITLLPDVVQQGEIAGCPAERDWLIAWPSGGQSGLIAYLAVRDDANEFICAWPFSCAGVRHLLRVNAVTRDIDATGVRVLHGGVGGVSLTAFDVMCAAAQRGIGAGDVVAVRLHGWAVMLEPAPTEPIVIPRETAGEGLLSAFAEMFARDGQLVLRTEEMAALIPRDPLPFHEVQGVVRAVERAPDFMGQPVHVLTVTVARTDEEPGDIAIAISVTGHVWKGDPPQLGQVVRGLVWMQAMIEDEGHAS